MSILANILIVEDDASIALLLQYNLVKKGYKVDVAGSYAEALSYIQQNSYSALILDWNLPGGTGLDICHYIRNQEEFSSLAVIMLTARGEENDEVSAFDVGVDDYITKPFSIDTLLLRLKAVLRRSKVETKTQEDHLQFEDILFKASEHRVYRGERVLNLGPTEYKMLEYFLRSPKKVFSREDLLIAVWGENMNVEIRTVDVHILRLRKELNAGGERDIIRTIRSAGYALDVQ
ncbi:phosphate regulon transcriptional regulatory protein PhoB [Commensalibacter intestini A911]|uniref:Chemotaxis protein CheY n=2 Tax=Commensalibacter intestini TaxID=479936 RepID=A0A251ZSW2_9PROT|nr:response regulator [Commensalibacter intestini]EHD12974.1 phosphate regulon transcriptional regulatory protein PhoB [Commensalibacter intestini A911]OUI77746.1 chemotaxis protein CheY [Commensalibacter intestini]